MVTGAGLAGVLRRHYSKRLLYSVVAGLVMANTLNAGADIGAIAAAVNLFVPIPTMAMIMPIALIILVLQVWGSYRLIAQTFKWLTLALFAYVGAALYTRPDPWEILRGTLIPTVSFDARFLATLVAILGTTISPYLFFWQASQEVEEEISMGRRTLKARQGATDRELGYASVDVTTGMFFSNVVMYFIILATAATLFKAGKTDIQSATEAAEALRPLAGNGAYALLALGLIGAGFLGVPVLTGSSAYAAAEARGWKHGLDEKPRRAKLFYAMIVIPTLIGMLINFVGINPISALFWTAVINGVSGAAPAGCHHAHRQQPRDHGRAGQWPLDQYRGLGDDCNDVGGRDQSRPEVARLSSSRQSGQVGRELYVQPGASCPPR
jgi:Mn2+/Fe2+ NRAMP family transporter